MKAINLAKSQQAPQGLWLFEPQIFEDERGFFYESFRHDIFCDNIGETVTFVQENHAFSKKSVARGLHYQKSPKAQGKLVRVVAGAIFDVAVDIRPNSATFGQWHGIVLSAENRQQFWIPAGFAHGYVALTDATEVLYKTTDYYAPDCEASIYFFDEDIGITLPKHYKIGQMLLSPKDSVASRWADLKFK